MISALEQYATLRRTEFDCPFQVGHSGNVYLTDVRAPMVPSVWHDDDKDVIVEDDRWEVFSTGYTGQYGYHGAVMHPSEFLGGALADDILATPGIYALAVVEVLPSDDEEDTTPAGWCVLRLRAES